MGAALGRPVSVACPAKVNVFLRILAREDSGYHQIETFFLAIGIFDRVTVSPSNKGIALEVHAADGSQLEDLGPPEANTVVRAARAFFEAIGCRSPAVAIRLDKSIPSGSGLGGGSSDAAGTLTALNAAHKAPLDYAELLQLGGRIGADVPFFCAGSPAALAWGRGDRILPCASPPRALVVVAVPRIRHATACAYRELSSTLSLPLGAAVLPAAPSEWTELASLAHNDFEPAAVRRTPVLARMRATLRESGAVLAGLAGSGSAIFGVFPGEDDAVERRARAAARRLAALNSVEGTDVRVASTLERWPTPSETTEDQKS